MTKWLLIAAVVLAACERVVDLTPDATFSKQPDAAVEPPDGLNDDAGGGGGDGGLGPDAGFPPDASVDSL